MAEQFEASSIERNTVVLVDAWGNPTGVSDKQRAHAPSAPLHLAFSVVLYRDDKVLLQQRAAGKYHFPSYWANACCSHPAPGEDVQTSAERRVLEELGCHAALSFAGSFTYLARCPVSGLVEHEFDQVFFGELEEEPRPEPSEVAALRFVDPADVFDPSVGERVTPWLPPAVWFAEHARTLKGH